MQQTKSTIFPRQFVYDALGCPAQGNIKLPIRICNWINTWSCGSSKKYSNINAYFTAIDRWPQIIIIFLCLWSSWILCSVTLNILLSCTCIIELRYFSLIVSLTRRLRDHSWFLVNDRTSTLRHTAGFIMGTSNNNEFEMKFVAQILFPFLYFRPFLIFLTTMIQQKSLNLVWFPLKP